MLKNIKSKIEHKKNILFKEIQNQQKYKKIGSGSPKEISSKFKTTI